MDDTLGPDEFFQWQNAAADYDKKQYGDAPYFTKAESAAIYQAVNLFELNQVGVKYRDLEKLGKLHE